MHKFNRIIGKFPIILLNCEFSLGSNLLSAIRLSPLNSIAADLVAG